MLQTTDERLADRVRRALNRPDAFVEEAGPDYVLRCTADRRRPAALRFEEPVFRALLEAPGLTTRVAGGWRAAAVWREPDLHLAERPGVADGETEVMVEGVRVRRAANLASSAIAWLARRCDSEGRPWLSSAQLAAAERLQEDHRLSGQIGRTTMDWSFAPRAPSSSRGSDPVLVHVAAKARVRRALEAVDARLRPVAERLCLRDLSLSAVERELGLASRGARPLLQAALDQLAKYYGIA